MRCAVILMMLATLVHGCGERAAGPSILDITLELGPAIAENGVHRLELDHTHSLDSGFIVPPPSPVGGYFHVHFKLRDPLERAFRYAIFYQNTSYAFPNTDLGGGSTRTPGRTSMVPGSQAEMPFIEQLLLRVRRSS